MKFYYFGATFDGMPPSIEDLESSNFTGMLFTYNVHQGDYFTRIARDLNPEQKIKYMVAIRPHTMSPQYLCMISNSINNMQRDRVQINLISGHLKPDESNVGGILGEVNDQSSRKDRSNYLIEYIEELDRMKSRPGVKIPDYYVSSTNIYTYEAAARLGQKIILPYSIYKQGYFLNTDIKSQTKPGEPLDLKNRKIMVSVGPIIRDTQEQIDTEFPKNKQMRTYAGDIYLDRERATTDTEFFTPQDFSNFIKRLEFEGIDEVILSSSTLEERLKIVQYVKRYTEGFLA
jgi:alkanesulfonate monooxygenase SsuD/methylene tetrahydromethanopterin reductase-like flavin-dependent oxidoreductase (luciferase family)